MRPASQATRRLAALLVGLSLLGLARPSQGRELGETAPAAEGAAPWRGTVVGLQSVASSLSADPSAELTYNPYWAVGVNVDARWWLGRSVHLRLSWDLERELTEADATTQQGEAVPGDVYARLAAARALRVPGVGLDLSGDLRLRLPTSPASRARTLHIGVEPSLRVSRTFRSLGDLTLGYAYRLSR